MTNDRQLARYDEPRRLAMGGKWVLWEDASDLLADKNAEIERLRGALQRISELNGHNFSTTAHRIAADALTALQRSEP